MMYVWICLMFGTGIPFLYVVGALLFAVQNLADRHRLLRLSQQPVRYGAQLPELILSECPEYEPTVMHLLP